MEYIFSTYSNEKFPFSVDQSKENKATYLIKMMQ